MTPKCADCYYFRRGSIITYTPAHTCLHPLVISMDPLGRLPAMCDAVRGENGACGREGALFRPADDGPADPIYRFHQ